MSDRIENVGLQGMICGLDSKPRKFSTCLECKHRVCRDYFVRAFAENVFPVNEGEYHVTEGVGPPAITKFRRENPYYLPQEALVDMALGTAFHQWVELANTTPRDEPVGRTSHEVHRTYQLGPYKLVGTMDICDFEAKEIVDIKVCGAYRTKQLLSKATKGEEDEYFHQVNVYRAAFMPDARKLGLDVFLKDFSGFAQRTYKLKDRIYPINVQIYDAGQELEMVFDNIEQSLLDEPRNCTPEETWNGMRCKKFCLNYLCMCYQGPSYNPTDVT